MMSQYVQHSIPFVSCCIVPNPAVIQPWPFRSRTQLTALARVQLVQLPSSCPCGMDACAIEMTA